MCTVAFLPRGPGYLLGHNRDESLARTRGVPPATHRRGDGAFLAPRDPDGGGTWLSVNEAGVTLCLLNAAEVDPARLPAAPRSRGLLVWEAATLGSIESVMEHLEHRSTDLDLTRAFQLVVAEPGSGKDGPTVGRLCWEGSRALWDLHRGPSLFVSSSVDQAGAERERSATWKRFLEQRGERGITALAAWLASHEPERGPLSVCMHRADAATLSRTLVEAGPGRAALEYVDGPPCEPSSGKITLQLGESDRLLGGDGIHE